MDEVILCERDDRRFDRCEDLLDRIADSLEKLTAKSKPAPTPEACPKKCYKCPITRECDNYSECIWMIYKGGKDDIRKEIRPLIYEFRELYSGDLSEDAIALLLSELEKL